MIVFKSPYRSVIVQIIVLLFIFLFVYAAFSKLLDLDKFRIQIGQSPMLTRWSGAVALGIPVIEFLLSVMLCIPRWRIIGLFGSFSLMVMFSAYIVVIMNFSPFVPCSCGGVLEDMTWGQHLVFNLVFVALAIVGIVLDTVPETPAENITDNEFLIAIENRGSRKPETE